METSENSKKFVQNGFLVVQSLSDQNYQGVCGFVWPLDEKSHKYLGIPYQIQNSVAVATDWIATQKYWQDCLDKKLNARLLLIETILKHPKVEISSPQEWEYMGYDISYVEGDFYSAIDQEILGKNITVWQEKLNNFGLFDQYKDASDFLNTRAQANSQSIETDGEFYILKISRYKSKK